MSQLPGAAAALGSSLTWAFASTRYAQGTRLVGSVRVNFARALVASPICVAVAAVTTGGLPWRGVTAPAFGWLALSVLCAYTVADGLFFFAATRVGVPTALCIASAYPLWATLAAATWSHEPFTASRAAGTVLCVAGVATLVRLTGRSAARSDGDLLGIALAFGASLMWAVTPIAVKHGGAGLDPWQVNAVRYPLSLLALGAVLAVRRGRGGGASAPKLPWRLLLAPALVDGVAGSACYVYALGHTDLAIGATLTSLAPLVSVPVAVVMGEERWSVPRFAAVAATVGGVAILVGL